MNRFIKKSCIYLLLVAIAIFLTFPFFWLLSTSLKGQMESIFPMPPVWVPKQPTLENYLVVFKQINIARALINSVIITAIGVFGNVVTAAVVAYPLARINFWGKKFIYGLILTPLMIPVQSTMIANYVTLKNLKLLNTHLGVVIPFAVNLIGAFIVKTAYEAIPHEMEEAARVDGCGEFGMWWRVMLPMIKPALATVSILAFVYFWNDFMWPLIILKSADKIPLQVALTRLETAFQTNFRYISAGGVIAMLPIMVFFAFTQRFFIEGAKGAVKG